MRAFEGFASTFPAAWPELRTALRRDDRKHRNQSGVRPSLLARGSEGSVTHRVLPGAALTRRAATIRAANQF